MSFLWWILIALLFLLSFIGILYPIIPSILMLWGGFMIYHFFLNPDELSVWFWIGMILLTVVIFAADLIANSYFVKKYGGSKHSERVAAISTIIGSFVLPPFGIILIPFLAVVASELFLEKDIKKSVKIGLATVIGFLSGSIAKVLIQLLMIGWFLLDVFI